MDRDSLLWLTSLTVATALIASSCAPLRKAAVPRGPNTLFVAANGRDTWSGTRPRPSLWRTDGPFATLSRAQGEARKLKGATVTVRRGTYFLAEALTFGPEDSGTKDVPVVYAAYPGERPVLSGGRRLTGWKPYRGKVWQCDLKSLGLKGLSFKQLFYNGRRQPLARVPNVDSARPRTGGFLYAADGGVKGSKRLLKYDPAGKLDPTRWAKPKLAEVVVYPYHNWNNDIVRLAETDPAKRIITLAADATYELIRDTRFFVQNVLEELDAPGEWYLDAETSTLYLWPPDGRLEQAEVVVPVLDGVVRVKGDAGAKTPVQHLRIEGFAIQACRRTAIELQAAHHCTIARCTITNTGDDGVVVHSHCRHCRVAGNDVAHIGSIGIKVSGQDNLATNNYLRDVGEIRNHFNHAMRVGGRANTLSHNLICDVPAWGIVFEGYDNVIEYNEIRHFGLSTNLPGGIYAYALKRPESVGGTVIRFNKIADAVGYGMESPGKWGPNPGWGIWLDDMISNTAIYGNVLVRNLRGGVVLHGGKDNVIENNIMGAGIPSTINHIRPGAEPCNNKLARNIIYYANADPRLLKQYGWTVKGITEAASTSAATPAFLCGWSSVKTAVSASDHNLLFPIRGEQAKALLCFRGAAKKFISGPWAEGPVADRFAWWRKQGYETHSVVGDPMFVDAARDDYRLRPDSPALTLGFKPIPLDKIGLRRTPERASWPVPGKETSR